MPSKARELWEEFSTVVIGQNSFLDAILPPIIFLLLNGLISFQAAIWGALVLSALIAVLRLWYRKSLFYALAGVGSIGLAVIIALLLGRADGFFATDLLSKYDSFARDSQPCHPPPNGSVDELHRSPMAHQLVLASTGSTCLQ